MLRIIVIGFVLLHVCSLRSYAQSEVWLYTYFRDAGQAGTCIAFSHDGLKFTALNGDKPLLMPAKWPGQNLMRDTSMVFHDGMFRAVWTSNATGYIFGYAESADLVHWSMPVEVNVFNRDSYSPNMIWAPEIHWNPVRQDYWITVSSQGSVNSSGSVAEEFCQFRGSDAGKFNVYVTETKDGIAFSEARLFFAQPFNVIDAQMVFDQHGPDVSVGRWIMVYKNEEEITAGGKNLHYSIAPANFSKSWSAPSAAIVGPGSAVRPKEMVEGPCLVRQNNHWMLYWDAFNNGHYGAASSPDLEHWRDRTEELVTPPNPRHGTVFSVPEAVFQRIQNAIERANRE